METAHEVRQALRRTPTPEALSERSPALTRGLGTGLKSWLSTRMLLVAGLLVAVLVVVFKGGAIANMLRGGPPAEWLSHTVETTDLEITVLATGMLESANTVEVLSDVEGQVGIISLLERGTVVKKGDLVVELDASALTTRRLEQRVVVQQARAATGQAKEALEVAESQAESDVRAAELASKFADLDLRKYLDGDYPQETRLAESQITLAEEELKRADERIKHSEELRTLGYLSQGQVDADKLTKLRSEVALQLAKDKKRLLEQFTYMRTKQDLESKVEESTRGLERRKGLGQVAIDQAQNKLRTQEATLELEESKLAYLEEQIEKCRLLAPQDGVTLYPMPEDEDTPVTIKQGGLVRQRQHIFSIPSTATMQVSASVHEAVVHLVKPGLRARIWADSFPDRELTGITKQVSGLPEFQSWRKSTVNFYPTKILIESPVDGLRPGMNAKIEILIEKIEQVLAVPVQAVVRSDAGTACYVLDAAGQAHRRDVELGKSNDQLVVVTSGLSAGERVVLSPDEVTKGSESERRHPDKSQ